MGNDFIKIYSEKKRLEIKVPDSYYEYFHICKNCNIRGKFFILKGTYISDCDYKCDFCHCITK